MARRDYRSAAATLYRKWYGTARWAAIRAHQKAIAPLCRMCTAKGITEPMTVCDHIEPHKGDIEKFFAGPFQSLCSPCHDITKKHIEAHGFSHAIGKDGFPTDPKHPFNA